MLTTTSTAMANSASMTDKSTSSQHATAFVGLMLLCFVPTYFASHLGYSWSLLVFVVPSVVGLVYTRSITGISLAKLLRPIGRTCAMLVPMGWVLTYFLANSFYRYPNTDAVVGLTIESRSLGTETRPIPVEEYFFYLGGCVFVAACYQFWLAASGEWRKPSTSTNDASPNVGRTMYLFPLVLAFVAVTLLSLLERKIAPDASYPGYALYLILCGGPWIAVQALRNRHRVHRSAFVFALLSTLFISVLWEPFLAIPRGYWTYVERYMLPTYVTPGLPLEAIVVWLIVPIATVLTLVDNDKPLGV